MQSAVTVVFTVTAGHSTATLKTCAAEHQVIMVVILEWATTWVDTGIQKVTSVIVMVVYPIRLLLHLLEQVSCSNLTSAGFVVDAGLFHSDMVDKMV